MPLTALAAGLVEAGHKVTLAIAGNITVDYGDIAKRNHYRLVVIPSGEASGEQIEQRWRYIINLGNPIRQAAVLMKHGFDPFMEAMYSAAKALCAENDLVIGHYFVFPLKVAAEKAGVPFATVSVAYNCIPSASIRPPALRQFGKWSYPLGWRLAQKAVNRIMLPRVNALRIREGLRPDFDAMTQSWSAERLNLIAVSRHICKAPTDWDARHHVCGFLTPRPGTKIDTVPVVPVGLDEFLAKGEPPVYLTFGSMMPGSFRYIQETASIWIEAVRRAGCRAIIQLPWDDLSRFQTDDRFLKVRRAIYSEVFPRCSMVVHHGGAGTTQAAILAGRPSIIAAHVSDQFFWGDELERLGVAGRTLKRKGFNSTELAQGIAHVLADRGMAERTDSVGRLMKQEDGIRTAIGLIEKHLS